MFITPASWWLCQADNANLIQSFYRNPEKSQML